MITTLGTHTPYQAAAKALRKDPEIVAGLNAVHKATCRTVSDIVLLICLETYFPERQLTHRTWPALHDRRDELTAELMIRLREMKEAKGVPVAHAIVRAVAVWLPTNIEATRTQFGGAKFVTPQPQFKRPEGMAVEKWAQDLHAITLLNAAHSGEITTDRAFECIEHHRLTFFEGLTPKLSVEELWARVPGSEVDPRDIENPPTYLDDPVWPI